MKESQDQNLLDEFLDLEERIKEIQTIEETCLNMIDNIFQLKSPNKTLKIGFIYLSDILHYYPKLSQTYVRMLIEYLKMHIELNNSLIHSKVLDIENANLEMEYTGSSLTERYKFCGAPLRWLPTWIAGVFRDYILNNSIQDLDETHLEILQSIIINQEFEEEDSDSWINFYSDIKRYIFVSLSNYDFSNIALNIAQKIFTFEKILPNLLETTFDTFILTMAYIYDSGEDYELNLDLARHNMKILLTFISEIKYKDCQSYIYKLIKTFAIEHNEIYLRSNLLDLMNNISQLQRGDIFREF